MAGIKRVIWKIMEICCPDKLYLSVMFKNRLNYKMDWKNPQSFNQKLQWMKLYDRNPLYSEYADKVEVRKFVAKTIGEQYLIPCIGVYERAEDIDYSKLPERFVLKCNHGAKYNVICTDKSKLDIEKTNRELNQWLKAKFWRVKREYHYKNIKPRIICEKYMEDSKFGAIRDYKVFIIRGEVCIIQVDLDRFENHCRNIYDKNWNLLDVEISYPRAKDVVVEKPVVLDEMIECAKKVASGFKEVRVDFYVIDDKLYFGEMTFFSGAGFSKYTPRKFEFELGNKLELDL